MIIVIDVEQFEKIKQRMQGCINMSKDGIVLDSERDDFVFIDFKGRKVSQPSTKGDMEENEGI